jgi:hypothetical protein
MSSHAGSRRRTVGKRADSTGKTKRDRLPCCREKRRETEKYHWRKFCGPRGEVVVVENDCSHGPRAGQPAPDAPAAEWNGVLTFPWCREKGREAENAECKSQGNFGSKDDDGRRLNRLQVSSPKRADIFPWCREESRETEKCRRRERSNPLGMTGYYAAMDAPPGTPGGSPGRFRVAKSAS